MQGRHRFVSLTSDSPRATHELKLRMKKNWCGAQHVPGDNPGSTVR